MGEGAELVRRMRCAIAVFLWDICIKDYRCFNKSIFHVEKMKILATFADRAIAITHLIRHFVTPSPTGEGFWNVCLF